MLLLPQSMNYSNECNMHIIFLVTFIHHCHIIMFMFFVNFIHYSRMFLVYLNLVFGLFLAYLYAWFMNYATCFCYILLPQPVKYSTISSHFMQSLPSILLFIHFIFLYFYCNICRQFVQMLICSYMSQCSENFLPLLTY